MRSARASSGLWRRSGFGSTKILLWLAAAMVALTLVQVVMTTTKTHFIRVHGIHESH